MKAYTYIDKGHFALTRLLIEEDILSSTFLGSVSSSVSRRQSSLNFMALPRKLLIL